MSSIGHPERQAGAGDTPGQDSLAGIGLSGPEERLYRFLLACPRSALPQAAAGAELSGASARAAARSLEAKGMVSRTPTSPPRYVPTPPELAVDGLIAKLHEDFDKARRVAARLAQDFSARGDANRATDLVEVVSGSAAFAQRYLQLQRQAGTEVVELDRPPYVTALDDCNQVEANALSRGVRYRSIYDRAGLEIPGRLQRIREAARQGDEAKVMTGVPLKLAIVDRRIGIIPLEREGSTGEDAVVVHESSLLAALYAFFETLWERALPLRFVRRNHTRSADAPDLTEEDRQLLALLAAGVKDQTIAHQLGMGFSTVERRIKRIMTMLGAQTRVQLGLQLAQQGWMQEVNGEAGEPARSRPPE